MNSDFLRIQRGFTRQFEGGYVNDPDDPGGETNLGVTKSVWLNWCRSRGITPKPMRTLTAADVEPLYEALYWRPLAAAFPWPLSAALYDMSVNHGTGDGNPWDEGGKEEGATFLAWKAKQLAPKGNPLQLALAACDARDQMYHAIVANRPKSKKFLNGWLRRSAALRVWLRQNAAPTESRTVFLTTKDGKRIIWEPKPGDVYGGQALTPAWVESMRLVYPPGSKGQVGGILLERCADGAFILSRSGA